MQIKNKECCFAEITKPLKEKLFWINKIKDVDTIFDFGCTGGMLNTCICVFGSSLKYLGYDMGLSKNISDNCRDGIIISSDFDELIKRCNPSKTVLVLSSIIHEIYSYSSPVEVQAFWDKVFHSGFKYIIIEDMCCPQSFPVSFEKQAKLVRKPIVSKKLCEFEKRYGSINLPQNLLHFLLKYDFEESWDSELLKNYIPLKRNELLSMYPYDRYRISYFSNIARPYLRDKILKDFGITICPTHVKIIFEML